MALVRGVAAVTVDNPDADGRIEKQGFGYTWRFHGKDEQIYDRRTALEPTWDYYSEWTDSEGNVWKEAEYVPVLRAAAPRGYFDHQDLSLDDWDQKQGTWIAMRG